MTRWVFGRRVSFSISCRRLARRSCTISCGSMRRGQRTRKVRPAREQASDPHVPVISPRDSAKCSLRFVSACSSPTRVLGIYSDPTTQVADSATWQEVVQFVGVVFEGRVVKTAAAVVADRCEIASIGLFELAALPSRLYPPDVPVLNDLMSIRVRPFIRLRERLTSRISVKRSSGDECDD